MNSSSSSPPLQRCLEAEQTLNNTKLTFVRLLQLALALPTFLAAFYLVRIYRRGRVNFHANLTLLFINIVLFCFVHSVAIFCVNLRYGIIQLTYRDPCAFLTPVWLVILTRVPTYAYFFAQPLLHFAVMTERLRATLLANRYEREGNCCGVGSAITVWVLTAAYMTFVCASALADVASFDQPMIITTLTSKYNSSQILETYYVALVIIWVTIAGDYAITRRNRTMRASRPGSQQNVSANNNRSNSNAGLGYSLSEHFQIRENIVAMRLILPIDALYGLMYSVYMVGAVFVRSLYAQAKITAIDYSFYYDLLNSFLFLYISISFMVYIYFLKFMANTRSGHKPGTGVGPKLEEGEVYFQQLQSQWGSG